MGYEIDGNDLGTEYGIYIERSTGLLGIPKRKLPTSHNWSDEDGEEEFVSASDIHFQPRDIILYCFIKASSAGNFHTQLTNFKSLLMGANLHTLTVPNYDADFYVYLRDAMKFTHHPRWQDGVIFGKFTLRLREPSPQILTKDVVATPVITPDQLEIANDTDITITCATGSTIIYYTTNGLPPLTYGTIYSDPFNISEDSIIKARAIYANEGTKIDSNEASRIYEVV